MFRYLLAGLLALSTPAAAQTIRLAGSALIGDELAPSLLAAYARPLQPQIQIGSLAAALSALSRGDADIAMAARPATDDERVQLLRAGAGDPAVNVTPIALDGIAVLVNPDNAISILTLDQVRRLFSGQIGNWSQLGGRDLPITIYSRSRQSDAFEGFRAQALGNAALAPGAHEIATAKELASVVAADPGAIGFAFLGEAAGAKTVAIALPCGLIAPPTPFFVRTEEYPLANRLSFITAAQKSPLLQDFVHFAASDSGQEVVRHAGFVDLAPTLGAPGDGLPRPGLWEPGEAKRRGDALAGITRALAGARRLSITFRFGRDGWTLDPLAAADIARVAAYKRANPGHKLILVGYAREQGAFDRELAASGKDAQTAALALATAGAPPDQTLAGGTLRPIACTDSPQNRRVEVWIR